jgi:hypothetical protein
MFKCLCQGGEKSIKRVGAVKGCVIFEDSGRCKKDCDPSYNLCQTHLKNGISRDNNFLSSIFK